MYLFEVPVIALRVFACHDGQGLVATEETYVVLPGTSKRSALLNLYKVHELAVKERPKFGKTGMMWPDRKRKIKRMFDDSLLRRAPDGKIFCSDGTECPAIQNGQLRGNCPLIDTIKSERR